MEGAGSLYDSAARYDRHVRRLSEADVRFWLALVERLGARRALELGCGTGRVTLPLARWLAARGGQVVGIDLLPAMLAGAAARLTTEPAAVRAAARLVEADMRAFQLEERFDLAIVPFNTLGHLHVAAERRACLETVRRHLAPGGRLAVDVVHERPDELQAARAEPAAMEVDAVDHDAATGRRLVRYRQRRYEPVSRTMTTRYAYDWLSDSGERTVERVELALHVFDRPELEALFAAAGFTIEAVYGDYAGAPFDETSPQLIVVGAARG